MAMSKRYHEKDTTSLMSSVILLFGGKFVGTIAGQGMFPTSRAGIISTS